MLNCGEPLVGYYSTIGYIEISSHASYLRSGKVEIDSDPVMLNPNGQEVSVAARQEPIYFGADF